jgi:hypothetical protein
MKRLTLVLAIFALAGEARADVIYSNLGPGESYDQSVGITESGPNAFGVRRHAIAFTANTDALFDSARLALGLHGGTNAMDLRLYTDASGRPGTVLETIHASGQMPHFGDFWSGHLVTFDSALRPLLQAGETYWVLPFASGDTNAGWNWNTQGASGPLAQSLEVEPTSWSVFTYPQGAFEVNGTPSPAPEPSGLALAGVGAAGLLGFVWRRRKPAAG